MAVFDFKELLDHEGHKIVCVAYRKRKETGDPTLSPWMPEVWNVALECETCNSVLIEFDNPKAEGDA